MKINLKSSLINQDTSSNSKTPHIKSWTSYNTEMINYDS